MMADDRALRVRGLFARELATALLRFGTAGAAQCSRGSAVGRGGRAHGAGQPAARAAAAAVAAPPRPWSC